MIEELLQNPEGYRVGKDYKATNTVFPVNFEGQRMVVKKAGPLTSLVNAYYSFQDQFFYKTRKLVQ